MEVAEQLERYETYLNEILKPDLKSVVDRMDKLIEELAEYDQLSKTIALLTEFRDKCESYKSLVDVGCGFYMESRVDQVNEILVNIGCDCYMEMSLEEAAYHVTMKTKRLNGALLELRDKSAHIKAHIKLMLLYMNQFYEQKAEKS